MTALPNAAELLATRGTSKAPEGLPEGIQRGSTTYEVRVAFGHTATVNVDFTATAETCGLVDYALLTYPNFRQYFGATLNDGGALNAFSLYAGSGSEALRNFIHGGRAVHMWAMPQSEVTAEAFFAAEIRPTFNDNPWMDCAWFRENWLRWVEHLPRGSERVSGLLAYYQSPEKRARNIRTPIKPGKYLQKFFADILSADEIREAALVWSNHFALREVIITQDADDIEKAYTGRYNGSCMCFSSGSYAGPVHPARVYAGPDLGIAYIGDLEEGVDGRVLVWPDKKLYYPKFYGDTERLEASLRAKGFSRGTSSDFVGARIQRIPFGDTGEDFVAPYVDPVDHAKDDGSFLILDSYGEVYLRNTSGVSAEMFECDHCSADVTRHAITETANGYSVCPHCLDEHYFRCAGTDEYHPNSRMAETDPEVEGTYCLDHVRGSSEWFWDDVQALWFRTEDHTPVELLDTDDTCTEAWAEKCGRWCAYHERYSLDVRAFQALTNGQFVHLNALRAADFGEWLAAHETALGREEHPDQMELLEAA